MPKCPICGHEVQTDFDVKLHTMLHRHIYSLDIQDQFQQLSNQIIDFEPGSPEFNSAKTAYDRLIAEYNIIENPEPEPFTCLDILNFWFVFTGYDPDKKSFNLLSQDYEIHRCNKNIDTFMSYDPTGALCVIYARTAYENLVKDARIKLIDILNNTASLYPDLAVWRIFHWPEIETMSDYLLDQMNQLLINMTGRAQIGNRDKTAERRQLSSSVEAVVRQLDNCHIELYFKNPAAPVLSHIPKFSPKIHVFDRLCDCLLALEQSSDGMYLCYISNHDTADGYFGFYIKSNGNLLSINERVAESYPGQHNNCRNGRWSEAKKFELFPYNFIFNFKNHDYKGYAKEHKIDHSQLDIFQLPPNGYMPLIFAMILLANKYTGASISDLPLFYLDSLMAVNRPKLIETHALTVLNQSSIAIQNHDLDLHIDTDAVKSGSYADKFKDPNRNHLETGNFSECDNVFVQLYAQDFELNSEQLFSTQPDCKMLPPSKIAPPPAAEFVGSQKTMEVVAYMQARHQLAEHIRGNMLQEYLSFGGKKAMAAWYQKAAEENCEKIYYQCVEQYLTNNPDPDKYIGFSNAKHCTQVPYGYCVPLNKPWDNTQSILNDNLACPITGAKASQSFIFRFRNWKQLEAVFGPLPKCVIGWISDRHDWANSILDATDPVASVGTVFEDIEIHRNQRLWTTDKMQEYIRRQTGIWDTPKQDTILQESPSFKFDFIIGFSKRGLDRLVKEYQPQIEAQERTEKPQNKT